MKYALMISAAFLMAFSQAQPASAQTAPADLVKQGVEAQPGTPEELARYIAREYQTWGKVVKEARIQAQ